ncbi:TonB-dependent receptor [Roseomonas sp. SG15]|uniref:TonB-dependent receptor n=1 Tax=Roseomonas indoligenes TaxID=2820811 RepID=A0A940MV03_9PROT|nr:TonB-dependent receptor [Pararoseomonas indoligenes]
MFAFSPDCCSCSGSFLFDGDARDGNNQLPGVPRHDRRAELLYSHPSGIQPGPNVGWAPGSYYADNANQLRVDPYALLNLRVSFDRGTRLSGCLEAWNLTDERSIANVAIAGSSQWCVGDLQPRDRAPSTVG